MAYDLATITNPSAALTDFSLMIDLSTMSASWWSANDTADGTKGRAFKDDGTTELACDWIDFDNGGETGWLRVKYSGTLASSGTQKLRIYPPLAANASYAAADAYGAYNAYDASWEAYYPIYGDSGTTLGDRTSHQEDGTLQTGVTFSGDKLVFAASNDGVDVMSSMALDGATAFTALLMANATDITVDRGLFYTGSHAGGEPLLMWMDNAGTDTLQGLLTTNNGTTGALTAGAVSASTDYHLGLSWATADQFRAYMDGVEHTVGGFPASLTGDVDDGGGANYTLGNDGTNAKDFYGTIWAISIHSAQRSTGWIAEERAQTVDQATFWGTWTWTGAGAAVAPIGTLSGPLVGALGGPF